MKDQRLPLIQIMERIERIEAVAQIGEEAFRQTFTLQDSIIRSFEVIGEATRRLSPVLLATQPQIEWSKITGFRNRLIHDYDNVDLALVWLIVEQDVPPLKQAITSMLTVLGESEG